MIPTPKCSHSHLYWEMCGSALFFYDFPVAVKPKLRQFGVDSKCFVFFSLSDILLRIDSRSKRIINSVLISKNTRQSWLVTVLLVFGTKHMSPFQPVDAQMMQFQSEDEKLQGATQSACNNRPVSQQDGSRQWSDWKPQAILGQPIPEPNDDTAVYSSCPEIFLHVIANFTWRCTKSFAHNLLQETST